VSVTAPEGFVASGVAAGIKGSGEADLALVATSDARAVCAAGVFTANLATAAPVQVSRAHLASTGGRAGAVVLSSGNANAATGKPGLDAAARLCHGVGAGLGLAPEEVLICQTGLIGVPFPIERAQGAIGWLVATRAAGRDAAGAAARAIMTTDTHPKEAVVSLPGCTVGAMGKGAAMLAPNMATMLAVVTTDALLDPDAAQAILRRAVAATFNTMTVDGCTSTNDTVLLLASGRAGRVDDAPLEDAVQEACGSLAAQMVADAEGATKVLHVVVRGARSDEDAHRAARGVADSLLVKCSVNGEDPYWGRVVSELGASGAAFDLDRVQVAYGTTVVCEGGEAAAHDAAVVAAHMGGRHVEIRCDLGLGSGAGAVLATDLGYGYLDENRTTS
jgi:glutamate N-acetyltransferase / amino-acid N-acetyltransferase